ncbi:alpha/beta hydrolase family protein, partial [Arenimonas composti]
GGVVVDSLPADPDHVVFGSFGSDRRFMLHRIDVRAPHYLDSWRWPARERLNGGLERDERWYLDARGVVRAAIVARDEKDEEGEDSTTWDLVWRPGPGAPFAAVLNIEDPDGFRPLAMSADGGLIYGTIEQERAQRELVAFDPVQKRITDTLFSRPGTDVVRALFDRSRRLIGAGYYDGGYLVSEYFDEAGRGLTASLAQAFRERTVSIVGRDRDDRRLLLMVDGADQPAQVYLLDRASRRASLLEETAPWLQDKPFAPARTLKVETADGFAIEAFLTLPPGDGPRPLVLMPHGGPIGVADRLHFNRSVQFVASLGYAVLQVNFRGSAGYGNRFREAAYHGYGTVIEDDIEAALEAALAQFPLDSSRICVVGASYGGYSGLSLAVRRPGRFRCVVSMSGVSDLSLFFTASDTGRSERGRELLEEAIGDPNTDLERMIATSPLFHIDRLTTPVMLVHGREDVRVDFEHTRRLLRMLNLAGRPPVLLEFEKEGHGLDDIDNLEATWHAVAGFLRQHLEGKVFPAEAGAAAADSSK